MDRVRGAPRWLCLKPCCAGYSRVLGVGHGYLRTNIKVNERAPVACRRRAPRPPHGGCPTPGSAHRPGRGAHGLMGRGRRTGRDAREARPPRPRRGRRLSRARGSTVDRPHETPATETCETRDYVPCTELFVSRFRVCAVCIFEPGFHAVLCLHSRSRGGTRHVRST